MAAVAKRGKPRFRFLQITFCGTVNVFVAIRPIENAIKYSTEIELQ